MSDIWEEFVSVVTPAVKELIESDLAKTRHQGVVRVETKRDFNDRIRRELEVSS